MSKRNPKLYLEDILISIQRIEEYTKDLTFDELNKDIKTIDALVRNLEIIGEAVKNLPQELTEKYSNIPWHATISIRNKVIHEYFGVDTEILWKTLKEDLPKFKKQVSSLAQEY